MIKYHLNTNIPYRVKVCGRVRVMGGGFGKTERDKERQNEIEKDRVGRDRKTGRDR